MTQKEVQMNDMPAVGDFFDVGTVCQITEIKELEDNNLKIVVLAEERCHLVDVIWLTSCRKKT